MTDPLLPDSTDEEKKVLRDWLYPHNDLEVFSCFSCGVYPLVFENDGTLEGAQEYEPHPENFGEYYCGDCAMKEFPEAIDPEYIEGDFEND